MKLLSEIPRERLLPVRLLILDVDGVMTGGGIYYSSSGEEYKRFDAQDGIGIKYWHRAGHQSAILSGRNSPLVTCRAEELGISSVRMGAKLKQPVLMELLSELNVTSGETVYLGDDLPDIPPMREVGLGIAVANAVAEVRDFADAVTQNKGGDGAIREVVETILKAQGRWDKILSRYFPEKAE